MSFAALTLVTSWLEPRLFEFNAGLAVGAMLAFCSWALEPPEWIERWREGAAGERKTARALQRLGREWTVVHDLPDGDGGGNIDHVVVGPTGVFVLETKNLNGQVHFENDRLVQTFGFGGTRSSLVGPYVRAASGGLFQRLKQAGIPQWVDGVIVVWGNLPQQTRGEKVTVVPGQDIAAWIQAQPIRLHAAAQKRAATVVRATGAETGRVAEAATRSRRRQSTSV
jgi:hypothetical protein